MKPYLDFGQRTYILQCNPKFNSDEIRRYFLSKSTKHIKLMSLDDFIKVEMKNFNRISDTHEIQEWDCSSEQIAEKLTRIHLGA
jgi:hypothetical protein